MAGSASGRLTRRIVREQPGRTAALAFVVLTGSAAELALPALLGRALDQALAVVRDGGAGPGQDGVLGRVLGGAALGCVVVVAVLVACDALGELLTGTNTAVATARLRHRLLGHLLATGPRLTRRFPEGDLVSRVVGNAADAGVTPSAAALLAAGIVPPIGGLVALTLIDPWLTVAFAAGLPVLALLVRVFLRDTSDIVGRYLRVQGTIAARLVDALAGIRTITAAHTQTRETRRVLGPLPDLRAHGERTWRVQARVSAGAAVLVPLLQAGVLAVAGFALASGRLTPGDLLAAGRYTVLAAGVGPIITQIGRLARARAATTRAAGVLSEPPPAHGPRTLPPGPGRLEFRDVTVDGVLDGVDLTIPGGVCAAIVGPSGAGKSTLAALPGRLTDPDSGRLLLDGVPLPELSRSALQDAVTYAFAHPTLLGTSPADAITYGLRAPADADGAPGRTEQGGPRSDTGVGPQADAPRGPAVEPDGLRAVAVRAARGASADAFISRLPEGYDTPMERMPMSGGEAQRLGLARAFARAGRVLVLDDATSSLDTVTEKRVIDVLTGGLAGRTRIIVARRAVTAARADLVVWLDGGRVRGVGEHRELWADPDYRAVFGAGTPVTEVAG